ncbi:hypothetical protein RUM43_010467 [Polyplax serrata]|uniref:Uncharacterized protein n=1 Tax=Polyplax serrata TaxID=468196 RepID=A0AAN8S4W1_POLSC
MSVPATLDDSPFSAPFHTLFYLGAWAPKSLPPKFLLFYVAYQIAILSCCLAGILFLFSDLFKVYNNFEKLIWNLCINTLFTGSIFKNVHMHQHDPVIRSLRIKLHKDEIKRTAPDDLAIQKKAVKRFRIIRRSIYVVLGLLVPVWLVTKFGTDRNGRRNLPVPVDLPPFLYSENGVSYYYAYGLVSLTAVLALFFIADISIIMYAFLIQISREYEILLKDVPKLNDPYGNFIPSGKKAKEINRSARRKKTKSVIREIARRQSRIVEYVFPIH